MSFSTTRSYNPGRVFSRVRPATIFATIILTALLAFEMFNYSTTEYALRDVLGDLTFLGLRWATILSIAFCGIDFAGIARLFTPERGADEPKEVWYLFGAWLLAATMNAILTWWGVAMAIASHNTESTTIMDPKTLTQVVPVFVALMVWLIRILIIGTISVAGERFIWGEGQHSRYNSGSTSHTSSNTVGSNISSRPNLTPRSAMPHSASPSAAAVEAASLRPEPTYHSMSLSAHPATWPGTDGKPRSGYTNNPPESRKM
jgi:hypothetical protein